MKKGSGKPLNGFYKRLKICKITCSTDCSGIPAAPYLVLNYELSFLNN
jgi:hypothetical protein